MRLLVGFALLLGACVDRAVAPPSPPDFAPPADLAVTSDLSLALPRDMAAPLAKGVCPGTPKLITYQQEGYTNGPTVFGLDGNNLIVAAIDEDGGVLIVPKAGGPATKLLKNECEVTWIAATQGHAFVSCFQGGSYDIDLSTNTPRLLPGLSGPPDDTQNVVITANAGVAVFASSSDSTLTLVAAGGAPQAITFPSALGSVVPDYAMPFAGQLLVETFVTYPEPAVTFLYDPVAQSAMTIDAGYDWQAETSGGPWRLSNGLVAPNANELIIGTYNSGTAVTADITLSLSSLASDGTLTPLAGSLPGGALGTDTGGGRGITQIAADAENVYFINNSYGLETDTFGGEVSVMGVESRAGGSPCLFSDDPSFFGAAYLALDDDSIYFSWVEQPFTGGTNSLYIYQVPKPN